MKITTILILGLIASLIVLAGCETQSSNSPPPSGPMGGGCGVAPNVVEDSNSIGIEALTTQNTASNSL